MRTVRTGFELRMELHTQKEGMIPQFYRLHQLSVRRKTGNDEAGLRQLLPVIIIEFIPVTVTLTY